MKLAQVKKFIKQPAVITSLSAGMVLVVGFLDFITGYELSLSVFYLIPIWFCYWYRGMMQGALLVVFSLVIWMVVDLMSDPSSSNTFNFIWNKAIRVSFFIVVLMILARLKKTLENERVLARTDTLTGLYNARFFLELLKMETERSRRYGRPLTLIYIDCDDFKKINDKFGHESGNTFLFETAQCLKKGLRTVDVVSRLGGDEFVVLLPETDEAQAKEVVERLSKHIETYMRQHHWIVTFSMGVAAFVQPLEDVDEMLNKVDTLMYEAKRAGKNTIKFST